MKTIIIFYLLWKSATDKVLTTFDHDLANALVWAGSPLNPAPSYVRMLADLEMETTLPEAWADYRWEVSRRWFGGA